MKNIALILIVIMSGFCNLLADTEKEIKAGIKHVTVYPDRAQVNHETTVELPAGKTVLTLGGLSPYIDAQSIQVKGYGDFIIFL